MWGELAKQLAERWLSLLVLPGVLYLAVGGAAYSLGWQHALDLGLLAAKIGTYAEQPAVATLGGQVLLLGVVLVAAAVVGLAAQGVGALAERVVLASGWPMWPTPFATVAGWWVRRRQDRWDVADRLHNIQYQLAQLPDPSARPDPSIRHAAARARARISVERPERLTWSGDRIQAAVLRLDRDHHVDLAVVWPYLEPTLPDAVRTEVVEARAALSRATVLAGWALLYAALTWWWWPAAVIGAALAVTAWHRIRSCADGYAQLLEVAARVYTGALATQLGITHTGLLTADLGMRVTNHLRTQLPHPRQP